MSNDDDLKARWAPTLRQLPGYFAIPELSPADIDWSVADDQNDEAPKHTGVMIALFPHPTQAQEFALEGGEPAEDLHVTLAYLGSVGQDVPEDRKDALLNLVTAWAAGRDPVEALVNGVGLFTTPEPVTYANIDSPQLPALHQSLHSVLTAAGFAPYADHGFTPHMTLVYGDRRDVDLPASALHFDGVVLAWAGEQITIPFTPTITPAAPAQSAATITSAGASTSGSTSSITFSGGGGNLQVLDRPNQVTMVAPVPQPAPAPVEALATQGRAFVADINGRTLITAPATAAMKEPTVEDITAEHMLWMHGRFVGAEVPNRNGALWSAGDLQMARGSVTNGPLNWLHDARHVIGTLAKADYVEGTTSHFQVAANAPVVQPHITATAAIWKWIYPDESYVIQQASEQEMLWYSMECISKQVACAGENGCGTTVSYTDYMAGAACEHVRQRASVRQFVNPVFLGGAVIVPPTRPGWAEADARVMDTAAGLAEAAFEQAGQPDITSSSWEQIMAQLVTYARR